MGSHRGAGTKAEGAEGCARRGLSWQQLWLVFIKAGRSAPDGTVLEGWEQRAPGGAQRSSQEASEVRVEHVEGSGSLSSDWMHLLGHTVRSGPQDRKGVRHSRQTCSLAQPLCSGTPARAGASPPKPPWELRLMGGHSLPGDVGPLPPKGKSDQLWSVWGNKLTGSLRLTWTLGPGVGGTQGSRPPEGLMEGPRVSSSLCGDLGTQLAWHEGACQACRVREVLHLDLTEDGGELEGSGAWALTSEEAAQGGEPRTRPAAPTPTALDPLLACACPHCLAGRTAIPSFSKSTWDPPQCGALSGCPLNQQPCFWLEFFKGNS